MISQWCVRYFNIFYIYLHFVMSTSATNNPAILNISSDPNDTSFKSVSSDVLLNDLNSVPELHGHSEPTSLKKKLYICVLLLLLGGCLTVLIYLSLRIDGVISLAGDYSLNVP